MVVRLHRTVPPILALILFSVGSAPPIDSGQIEIIHKGCFHDNEVSEQSGGDWEALYGRGDAFELVSRAVGVKPCHDDISDAPDKMTGRAVVVDAEGTPLFLVRGIGHVGAKPVSIPTAWPAKGDGRSLSGGSSKYVRPGERFHLTLGGANYQLAAKGRYDPTRPASDRLLLGYRLTLIGPSGQSQDLPASVRFAEDGVPTLEWAGDLDRDGRLDLYMDMTDHYNVTNYVLLLSSRAATGKLVKQVASRRYVGC